MFSRKMLKLKQSCCLVAVLAALPSGGCGDGSGDDDAETVDPDLAIEPVSRVGELCVERVDTVCERFYDCLRPSDIAGANLPPTLKECKLRERGYAQCATITEEEACGEGYTFNEETALACIESHRNTSCMDPGAGDFDLCNSVCEAD